MSEIFANIPVIPYEGPKSTNPLAFKFYDADRIKGDIECEFRVGKDNHQGKISGKRN